MTTWSFTVYLKDKHEISDQEFDRLFEAGCDDGTCSSGNGIAWIGFDRDAMSLQDAIRSAVSDIRRAGLEPTRVEIEESYLAPECVALWGEPACA